MEKKLPYISMIDFTKGQVQSINNEPDVINDDSSSSSESANSNVQISQIQHSSIFTQNILSVPPNYVKNFGGKEMDSNIASQDIKGNQTCYRRLTNS